MAPPPRGQAPPAKAGVPARHRGRGIPFAWFRAGLPMKLIRAASPTRDSILPTAPPVTRGRGHRSQDSEGQDQSGLELHRKVPHAHASPLPFPMSRPFPFSYTRLRHGVKAMELHWPQRACTRKGGGHRGHGRWRREDSRPEAVGRRLGFIPYESDRAFRKPLALATSARRYRRKAPARIRAKYYPKGRPQSRSRRS